MLVYLFLCLLLGLGFWFRYIGISQQLSFWNDEGHAALNARNILWGVSGQDAGIYQILFYYITAASFKLLGINELSGRLPSVIAGTLGVAIIFIIAIKMFNDWRKALFGTFLMAFSQIQLAWSTQLRPYIWLEIFTLLIMYFSYRSLKEKYRFIDRPLVIVILIALFSTLFHGTALVNLIWVSFVVLIKTFNQKKYLYLLVLIPIGILTLAIIHFSGVNVWTTIFRLQTDVLHYRIFLTHNYWWLLLGAIAGSLFLFNKDRILWLSIIGYTILIFSVAIFKVNSQYVRYSLPAFPLLYILFSSGVVDVSGWLRNLFARLSFNIPNKHLFLSGVLSLSLLWPIKEQKILLLPRNYYSINADVRENPIVDYKVAFSKIEFLIEDKKPAIVVDAWNDRVPWYLPGQKFVFLTFPGYAVYTSKFGEIMIRTIEDFENIKGIYPYGVVIVEDWPSLTPPELQNHVRATLKHEFNIQDLPYNEDDHWGISVYSWGI